MFLFIVFDYQTLKKYYTNKIVGNLGYNLIKTVKTLKSKNVFII